MEDVLLLGAIAAGLGLYCLHLNRKYDRMMRLHQYIFECIYDGDVVVKEVKDRQGKSLYLPVPVEVKK